MKKEFCPYCGKITDVNLFSQEETLPVLSEPIEYQAYIYKCGSCNNDFASEELEQRNFKVAYDIYRGRHKLLSPETIKAIRKNYKLSQRNFSKFLGWGEITIHRYESGSIQDTVHNETLVLIKDNPHNALKILELNRDNLPEDEAKKIESRIRELIEKEQEKKICIDLLNINNLIEKEPTIDSGFIRLDSEKFENLILYILEQLKGVFKTKLNKLLWYCDFKHFSTHTVSITGSGYVHLPYGPVPNNYELHLWRLLSQKKIESEELIFDENVAGEKLHSLSNANISLFNTEELRTIDYVVEKLGKLNAKQISVISHNEKGYKQTNPSDSIPYSYALELSI